MMSLFIPSVLSPTILKNFEFQQQDSGTSFHLLCLGGHNFILNATGTRDLPLRKLDQDYIIIPKHYLISKINVEKLKIIT